MKRTLIVVVAALVLTAGCESLRFAPSEQQKQLAYETHQTALTVEQQGTQAHSEQAGKIVAGTGASLAYAGMPKSGAIEDFNSVAEKARADAVSRPDPWRLADNVFELAIGLSGLLGGVYGTRAVRFLRQARAKSQALKEVVEGNELFKKQNTSLAEDFKQAQSNQSRRTRQLVAKIKK